MGTESFPGVKSGWGVTLTPHRGQERRELLYISPPLWALRPVQSLSASAPTCFG